MKYTYTLFFLLCIAFSMQAQTISSTEAVEYDPTQNRYLISNGTSILQQFSGSETLTFFGEEDADYGMEVMNGTLYTISGGFVQSVKIHDLVTEALIFTASIPGSDFLNGMASDPSTNRLWITDFGAQKIYEVDVTDPQDPVVSTVVDDTQCTPNGITLDAANNRLCYVCWGGGQIRAVDLSDYSTSSLVTTALSNMDGIDEDGEGNFYVSSWSPEQITRFSSDFSVEETITSTNLDNPADISYAIPTDTLAIANSGDNTVEYLYLGETVGVTESAQGLDALTVAPNPTKGNTSLRFNLEGDGFVVLNVADISGKNSQQIFSGGLPQGNNTLIWDASAMPSGVYIVTLNIQGEHSIRQRIVVE